MKAKSLIAFLFLIVLWLIAAGVECDLAVHLGFLFSALVGVLVLFVLLAGLIRAPEGYEDDSGFHVGAQAGAALR